MDKEYKDIKESWDIKAEDWNIQVGEEGDRNRIENSDPFLWEFLGEDVKGKYILDAGCGTGYLCRKLSRKKAIVTGVDISDKMIEIAKIKSKEQNLDGYYLVDSVSELKKLSSNYYDIVVSNYVLQDTPDLDSVMKSLYNVSKDSCRLILVITHPCFPQSEFTELRDDNTVHYKWDFPYFEVKKEVFGPWAHFKSDFIAYQRPLSNYWRTFSDNGFIVTKFDEPVVKDPKKYGLDERTFLARKMRPNSVIFELKKIN